MAGFLYTLVAALIGKTCVVCSPSLPFDKLVRVIDEYKVALVPSSPAMLQYVANEMRRTGIQLNSVRKINVGGGVLTEALVATLKAVFKELRCISSVYAPAEACGIVCLAKDAYAGTVSMGCPNAMVELKIIDVATGEKLGPNEAGELCYRIPSVMKGYYKDPEKTAQVMDAEGWCRSGDMARYDADGRVHFIERLHEVISCMGERILPAELEELLLKHHDGIAEVAIAGLPHRKYGEAATAFVVLKQSHKPPGKICEEDIERTISDSCAKYKHLHGGVYFVHRLPKTHSGNVKRSALRAHAFSTSTI
ncbi:4-coumarate--CoA ligase 1 [Ixodes scapularis]|uniref:4-coumarate--CoA ligase 1 n=1 Tax=Ixodes scapularis TaxID=6945 RepID=UPI001A9CCE1F|nr:4-coumarate--CoA ligase 1 [Ixodes scapularis]